jgi:prephenate dehydratase
MATTITTVAATKTTATVAYLGPPASYSHQVALQLFPSNAYTLQPVSSITGVFEHIASGNPRIGIVPFENSTNGHVLTTLDGLQKLPGHVCVVGETYFTVHHQLLARRDVKSTAEVTHVYTHPQAFGQCDGWLRNSLPEHVERVEVPSTSRAAEIVATEDEDGRVAAAVASVVAAERWGLNVLAKDIEDKADNVTRFFVLKYSDVEGLGEGGAKGNTEQEAGYKTLMRLSIDHSRPGALCDALQIFKKYSLNLTSLASRPSRKQPWNYVFFVEFEASIDDNTESHAVGELEQVCLEVRVLGSYSDMTKNKLSIL